MWCYVFLLLCHDTGATGEVNIKTKDALNLLDDFAEIGVKSVSLVSDGEALCPKHMFHLFSMLLTLELILQMQQMVGNLKKKNRSGITTHDLGKVYSCCRYTRRLFKNNV